VKIKSKLLTLCEALVGMLRGGSRRIYWVDAIALVIITAFVLSYFPREILTAATPATGGDTGSHFWPVHTLVNHGMFQGQLRVWNPGNLAGEPHLIHYFPLPFMLMGLLSLVVPIHTAFNIGTMLCVVLLPLSLYFCLTSMRVPRPGPILGASFSTVFLLTDTYSAWGGNLGSTLAGQFCHLYALVFLLLGLGFYCRELSQDRFPIYSSLCFAGVAMSHGYILMLLPIVALLVVVLLPIRDWKQRLASIGVSGVIAFLLSAWWLLPMLDNNKWVTAYGDSWLKNLAAHEYAPYSLYPIAILGLMCISLPSLFDRTRALRVDEHFRILAIWSILMLVCAFLVVVFPKIGLVDIRAIPQVHLMVCIVAAVSIGVCFSAVKPYVKSLVTVLLVGLSLLWASQHGQHYKGWAIWNYSGWDAKPLYANLVNLSSALRGSFSDPRVIYEHASEENNRAGTPRVFENLPYFANRATLESLYMQASPISGPVYAAQAMVSLKPSCPFPNFRCPKRNFPRQVEHLKLLGVRDLILVTPEIRAEVEASDSARFLLRQGPWYLYRFNEEVSLVDFFTSVPELAPEVDWRYDAYDWFLNYSSQSRFRVLGSTLEKTQREDLVRESSSSDNIWIAPSDCRASVTPSFSGIELKTNCPGYAHFLKFSYNHSFVADSGDKPFLVYPGFIGIIPSATDVRLTFGAISFWRFFSWLSLFAALGWTIFWVFDQKCHQYWRLGMLRCRSLGV